MYMAVQNPQHSLTEILFEGVYYIHVHTCSYIYILISVQLCLYIYMYMAVKEPQHLLTQIPNRVPSFPVPRCEIHMSTYMFIYIYIYLYLYSYVYTFVGPPVNQCGEHWSGGPGSLVRGAKEKLYTPDRLSAESCPSVRAQS